MKHALRSTMDYRHNPLIRSFLVEFEVNILKLYKK